MSSSRGGPQAKTLMDIFRLRQNFNDVLLGICEFDLEPILFDALPRIEIQTGNDRLLPFQGEQNNSRKRPLLESDKFLDVESTLSQSQKFFDSFLENFNAPTPPNIFCALKNKLNREFVLDTVDLMNRIERNQLKLIESEQLQTVFIRPTPSLKSLERGFLLLEEATLIGEKPIKRNLDTKNSSQYSTC